MTTHTHTAGEWSYSIQTSQRKGMTRYDVWSSAPGTGIVGVGIFHFYRGNNNPADNVKLIAAAPELLDALEGMVLYYEGKVETSFLIYARAAIAKAKGE